MPENRFADGLLDIHYFKAEINDHKMVAGIQPNQGNFLAIVWRKKVSTDTAEVKRDLKIK